MVIALSELMQNYSFFVKYKMNTSQSLMQKKILQSHICEIISPPANLPVAKRAQDARFLYNRRRSAIGAELWDMSARFFSIAKLFRPPRQASAGCAIFLQPPAERQWRGVGGHGNPKDLRDKPRSVRSHGPATAKAHTPSNSRPLIFNF